MDAELTLSLAFLAGLAGAGHCWTMCGGLVGGLFLSEPGRWRSHLTYHAARVLAYTLLGALAAGIGQAVVLTGGVGRGQAVLYVLAGVLVMLAGVRVLRMREQSVACTGCPSRPPAIPAVAGFLNGLMPCALVFSLTLKAATAPSMAVGALWLLAFGLGTVPAMALAAVLAQQLGATSLLWLRRGAGVLVLALGLQAVWAGAKFFNVMLHL